MRRRSGILRSRRETENPSMRAGPLRDPAWYSWSNGCAEVAELADAPDLGSGRREARGVRRPPFALLRCSQWACAVPPATCGRDGVQSWERTWGISEPRNAGSAGEERIGAKGPREQRASRGA